LQRMRDMTPLRACLHELILFRAGRYDVQAGVVTLSHE
jgi:hypothetical protein